MKRKLRKPLSWLLTVAMIFSLFCGMIPTASAESASNDYISFEYDYNLAAQSTTMTVNVQDENGNPLGSPIVVTDFYKGVIVNVEIVPVQSQYEILSVEATDGASITSPEYFGGRYSCNLYSLNGGTITVTLCPASDDPIIKGDDFDTGTVEYRLYKPQILKMLYLNGDTSVNVDTDIKSVQMRFVESSGIFGTTYGVTEPFQNPTSSGAGNTSYRYCTLGIIVR